MNNPTKNSQEKVVLEWNGVVLKSMKDLRQQEASQIETIRIEDRDCLAELCRILSVAYETGGLSHEDLAERRERLRQQSVEHRRNAGSLYFPRKIHLFYREK